MDINYSFPLWTIILTLVLFIVPIIWGLIRMYFNQIQMKEDILRQDKEITSVKDGMITIKKDIEYKLDRHKQATDEKLSKINDITVETHTLVKLLVDNKINK